MIKEPLSFPAPLNLFDFYITIYQRFLQLLCNSAQFLYENQVEHDQLPEVCQLFQRHQTALNEIVTSGHLQESQSVFHMG